MTFVMSVYVHYYGREDSRSHLIHLVYFSERRSLASSQVTRTSTEVYVGIWCTGARHEFHIKSTQGTDLADIHPLLLT